MRIEWIEIVAFGPFTGQRLDLAPGMSVIYGPNESGKSSWHAAIYAGVCGLPRGKGAPTRDVRAFAELHKPWDDPGWEVRLMLQLQDGRRIEMHQDLAGRVDCSAVDTTTGRDVSNEIMDGTPDASRWLGLDRRSFLATACVRQADLLAILDDPDSLQEHLQRAAATRGTDATAAAAIQRLEDFGSDQIGLDRANSTKPLRRAVIGVDAAGNALDLAREQHERFTEDSARAERAIKKAEDLEHEANTARALLAEQELDAARAQLRRINELRSKLGDQRPPNATALRREINEARAAFQAWKQQPTDIDTRGETASELEARLEALPEMPDGDVAPDASVSSAWHAYELARDALARHPPLPPPPPPPPKTGEFDGAELREAIRLLEQEGPTIPASAGDRVDEAQARLAQTARGGSFLPLIALGGIAVVIGVVLAIVGSVASGAVALVGGAGAIGVAFALRNRRRMAAIQALRAAESELGEHRFALDRITKEKAAVRSRLETAGLPDEPTRLREILASVEGADAEAASYASRAAEVGQLRAERDRVAWSLEEALAARSVTVTELDVEEAYASYARTCDRNAALAAEARGREPLERLLEQRLTLEQAAAEARQQREAASSDLRSAAASHGLEASNDAALADTLSRWIDLGDDQLAAAEAATREWSELDALLAGNTVEDVADEVQRLEVTWNTLSAGVDQDDLHEARGGDGDMRAQAERLVGEASAARSEADTLTGKIQVMASQLPSVAETEERLAAAEDELERVRRLERTVSLTLGFLRDAQDRVHRDIAPVLAGTIRSWLPIITDNRYTDAAVDPATLAVRVRTEQGAWRDARLLSQGTREQIYLLLRVALAEHLTTRDEVSPLILDDVTVQCDTTRTERIAEILHEVSRTRQVLFFTQEDDVLQWAEGQLVGGNDMLVRLDSDHGPYTGVGSGPS